MSLNNLKTINTLSLDFYNNNIKTMNVKQLDAKSRYVKISCTEHGKFFVLNPETMSAYVRCKKPDGFSVLNDCTISSDGTLLLELTQQMLAVAGRCTVDIMIVYTNLVENDEDGTVELSAKGVTLNSLSVTDDDAGNVSISADEESDFSLQQYTADTIEDIYKLNTPVLSTMTFYINVLSTAIDHSEIESSYEFDALTQGLKNQELIEKHMKALEETLTANENQRQENETQRETAESQRQESFEEKIEEWNRNVDEAVQNCNAATAEANTTISNANTATDNANEAATNAQNATTECIEATNTINETVEKCATATTSANEAAELCQSVVDQSGVVLQSEKGTANGVATLDANIKIPFSQLDIANDLLTEAEGKVLDARQGKILNDLIAELKDVINNMHEVYHGVDEPDSSIGKDGDIYMKIIEDTTETEGE